MQRLILRWVINTIALWVAINYVPGIEPTQSGWVPLVVMALVFGFVNSLIRPLLTMLTCPLLMLTLGLGTLLINTFIFWLSGWVGTQFGYGFTVDGFWAAFFGALVVSFVSMVLSVFVRDELEGRRRRKSE